MVTPGTYFPGTGVANLATGHAGQRPGCSFTATCWRPGMFLYLAGSKFVNETTSDTSVCIQFLAFMKARNQGVQWTASQWLARALISGRSLTDFISPGI